MNEQTKKDVRFLIDDNKRAIKNPLPKIALKEDPDLLVKERKDLERCINEVLTAIQQQYAELLPFVKELRKHIRDITEESHICAVYLLLCHASQDWNSLFLLGKHGDLTMQIVFRRIKESLALTELFTLEYRDGTRKNLDKWFSGNIIDHSLCRDAQEKFFQEMPENKGIDIKTMLTRLYQSESLATHVSYSTMLECISPFTEDFDFSGRTQYFRTCHALPYAKGVMDAMNITLKLVYLFLMKDSRGYERLDEILVRHARND